jgi:hypothetical protein
VISSSDQQVVIALRVAASRIAVPPEARWMRDRQSGRGVWLIAMLTVAFLALIAVLVTLRAEPRIVPGSVSHTISPSASRETSGSAPVTYEMTEDTAWAIARLRTDFVVLRPSWVPRPSDSVSNCQINQLRSGEDVTSSEYHVWYSHIGSPPFCSLTFGGHRDAAWVAGLGNSSPAPTATPVPLGTLAARGTVVHMSQFNETIYLQWVENGVFYEIIANGYVMSDLVRALNSLEPMK